MDNLAKNGGQIGDDNPGINIGRDKESDDKLKEIERQTTNALISLTDKEPEKFALFLENISVPY